MDLPWWFSQSFVLMLSTFTSGFIWICCTAESHRKRVYYSALYASTYVWVLVCIHQLCCALLVLNPSSHSWSVNSAAGSFAFDMVGTSECYLRRKQLLVSLGIASFLRYVFAFRLAPVLAGDLCVAASLMLAVDERDAVLVTTGTAVLSHTILTIIAHCETVDGLVSDNTEAVSTIFVNAHKQNLQPIIEEEEEEEEEVALGAVENPSEDHEAATFVLEMT